MAHGEILFLNIEDKKLEGECAGSFLELKDAGSVMIIKLCIHAWKILKEKIKCFSKKQGKLVSNIILVNEL